MYELSFTPVPVDTLHVDVISITTSKYGKNAVQNACFPNADDDFSKMKPFQRHRTKRKFIGILKMSSDEWVPLGVIRCFSNWDRLEQKLFHLRQSHEVDSVVCITM